MPRILYSATTFFLLLAGFLVFGLNAQVTKKPPQISSSDSVAQAVSLAKTGHCKEALPALKKALRANSAVQRDTGFSGVRCAMAMSDSDAAIDFLRALTRKFPHDPDVLYLSVHTYSDLSTRASIELATAAPGSPEAHQLNAESLEVQGKWDEAEKEYREILAQNPRLPGIHYRLGRILVSKPDFTPAMADQAKEQFQQELQIDPSNAG